MDCKICGEEIVLVPSAAERAKRFGGRAADYTALFTAHAHCQIAKRERETRELMERLNAEYVQRMAARVVVRCEGCGG